MSSLPIRTTRDKLPASGRGGMTINANIIILLVKVTFVSLICGSSYLAGSLWGRHSLEAHDAPLSVRSMIRNGVDGGANDAECEEARRSWIELRVLEGVYATS